MNGIETYEYRIEMEDKLAQDFWFMCNKIPDCYEVDFDWHELCIEMEWGNGWLASFYDLCRQLLTEVKSNFHWIQLKEKYGQACCYYYGDITPYGRELISNFEKESTEICEFCGNSGQLRKDGWVMCLCDDCYNKSQNGEI